MGRHFIVQKERRMERRNTVQKEVVLNAVRSMRGHATADEVYSYILNDHPNIGKGTVYRNLNVLSEEGKIRKVEVTEGPNRFDFTVKDHYHITCVKCNRIFDVDMDVIPKLESRIHDTHGIRFLGYDILFKGLCTDCQMNNNIQNTNSEG